MSDSSEEEKTKAVTSADDPHEETQRLNPAMVAATAKVADAKAKANEVLRPDPKREAEDLKQTPKAPNVISEKAKEEQRLVQEEKDKSEKPPKAVTKKKPPRAAVEAKEQEEPAVPISARLRAWVKENVDPLIGAGLGLSYVGWLLGTARSLGFSRDEGFYFQSSYEYQRWFKLLLTTPGKAFDRAAIDPIWTTNHEHPSLMKSLFGLSHLYLWDKWKIIEDQSTALRLPGMMMMGLAIMITYLFATQIYSRRAGIIAALALGLMPNVFYHAHLACFDVPIMAMWIACIYAYWNAEKKGGLGPAILAGIVYGLTLETKHNAWMLPAVFVPHAIFVHGRAMADETAKTARLPIPASLVAMATLGPMIFIAFWPWLWNDTLPRIQEYVNFHVHHEYYNIEFLGQTYFAPPSPKSYMPVMIAATVPTVTLVLFLIGALDRLRIVLARLAASTAEFLGKALPWPKERPEVDKLHSDVLLLLSLAVPLAVFLLPRTPIFGGTKHWITAYPALAIFAGRGFDLVANAIEGLLRDRIAPHLDEVKRRWVIAFVAGITFVAPFAVTRHSHPFGLSSYVPFFGGTAGGADLGLNRQFWGFTTQSLNDWFSANTKPGDTVYIMDTAWASWQRMIDEKRIPPYLRGVGSPAEAELAMVHHEQHINEVDYNIWTEYGTPSPAYVLMHDGVPIISVYRRPRGANSGGVRRRGP